MIKQWIKALASLKITVIGLVLMTVLVLVGTLDQVNLGIYYTVKKYFKSWIVWHDFGTELPVFPGGMTVGLVLAVNLIAAHTKRFTLSRKKLGIWLIHSSILVLLIGGAISGWVSTESQMALTEGDTSWYSRSIHKTELVLVLPDDAGINGRRITVDLDEIQPGNTVEMGDFWIQINEKLGNTRVRLIDDPGRRSQAFRGAGHYFSYEPVRIDRRPDGQNFPLLSVTIGLVSDKERPIGQYMLTTHIQPLQKIGDTPGLIGLQPTRYYWPYAMHLVDFVHKKYPGTTIPSYFSSDVIIKDNQTVLPYHIYMNHPLRYNGVTYFQASFDESETVSVLQLVENPVWWIPYFSCLVLAVGLLWQLLIMIRR